MSQTDSERYGQGSGDKASGASHIVGDPGHGKDFNSVSDAISFGFGWIKHNYSKSGGADIHEYGFRVYAENGKIFITPVAEGPSVVRPYGTYARGHVDISITSAGLNKNALGLAEGHTHPTKDPINIALGMQKLAPSDEDRYFISAARWAASGNWNYMPMAERNINYSPSYTGYLWRIGEKQILPYGP